MYHPVNPATGFGFIIMFVVIVMGGLGSIKGAVIAGLLIGTMEQLATLVLSLQAQSSIAFVLFLVIVLVRPQGLFGSRSEA